MDIRKKQREVVEALEDIKGRDIVVLNTGHLPTMFERVIIASGESNRQLRALAESVRERMKKIGAKTVNVEGSREADWVLIDLGDIIVHVMHPTARSHYNLEELWSGKTVRIKRTPVEVPVAKKPVKRPAKKTASRAGTKLRSSKKPARPATTARPAKKAVRRTSKGSSAKKPGRARA